MLNLAAIDDDKDLVTKEYVDSHGGGGSGSGVSIIKLWENPSISSSFSAQTITVSGSWDAYIISFIPRTDYGASVSVAFPADGVAKSFGAPYGSTNCYRTVTCNSSSLVFDGGHSGSNCGIPTYIWGIKYASGDPTVLGDFVVERGETDDWKWKKWNSGDIECWTRKTHSTVISDKYGNGWYSGELYETIPSGLLTQVDSCVISGTGSGAGYSIEFGGGLSTTRTQSFWLLRVEGSSAPLTADISVNIKGRWK